MPYFSFAVYYAGFEILPTNIAQAVTLAKLEEEELVHQWRRIIEDIPLDKITVKTIRNLIFPPTESDREVATIKIPAYVHDNIHSEAAKRGLSIVDFIFCECKTLAFREGWDVNERNNFLVIDLQRGGSAS